MPISENVLKKDTKNKQGQYLLFLVGDILYAIEALKAREIVEYTSITKVPMMHPYVKGVTNIRGSIVPVVDLYERFGFSETTVGDKTSIVVVNHIDADDEAMQIGIIIDEVYEVDVIENEHLKEAPKFGSKINPDFILKMAKYKDGYISILNTDIILDIEELSNL